MAVSTMLRITVHDNPELVTLQVEGTLAASLVPELERCWEATHSVDPGRAVRIDLRGVTYVDESGKKLLAALHAQGAEFAAAGCCMKAIVAEIASGSRSVRTHL
jgi:anti-anti-sigma regulatory factor